MKRDPMYRSLESDGQTGNPLAKPPPEEPDALVAHVRDCEGPGRQRPGLLGSRPKLSVVTCNYNHGRLIGRTIETVIAQSRPPDEYIIVDDGSTDNSVDVIQVYANRHPCIRFERIETNTGLFGGALERGVSCVTGEYLFMASADDYVLPCFFEKAMRLAEAHPEAGIIFGKFVAVDATGQEIGETGVAKWLEPLYASPDRFLREYLDAEKPSHSLCGATIYRRAALNEIGGFRPELGSWCDTFAARAIALKYGACYMPERCMAWTVSPTSVSGSTAGDVVKGLNIVARAATLMRSSRFADRFPASHVKRWESAYRELLIGTQLQLLRGKSDALGALFSANMIGNGLAMRWMRTAGVTGIRALAVLLRVLTRSVLFHYRPGGEKA